MAKKQRKASRGGTSQEKAPAVEKVVSNSDGPKTLYDKAMKLLLSNVLILAIIVKATVKEAADYTLEQIADLIRLEPLSQTLKGVVTSDRARTEDPAIGNIICDVLFTVKLGEVFVRINVEAQNDASPKYSLITRAITYACQLVAQQTILWAKNSQYDNIRKTYTIWLVSNAPQHLQGQIWQFGLYGNKHFVDGSKECCLSMPEADKVSIVMAYLPDVERASEVCQEWLRVFSVLCSRKSTEEDCERVLREYGVDVKSEMKEEISAMCTLGQGIVDEVTREVSERKDKEFAVTLEQIERERERERERVAVRLMASGMPVDKVAECLELPMKVMQSLASQFGGHSAGACLR